MLASVIDHFFPELAAQARQALARELRPLFVETAHPAKTAILRQGEVWRQAYLVQQGLIRLHFLHRDGHEYNKNFCAESSLVCPIAPAMWREPSLFGITTIEATILWVADAAEVRRVLESHQLWLPLRAELLTRLVMAKLQREHELLSLDGRQRYAVFCERFGALAARVPLKHLASYLGLTDVSLSRLRRVKPGKAGRD